MEKRGRMGQGGRGGSFMQTRWPGGPICVRKFFDSIEKRGVESNDEKPELGLFLAATKFDPFWIKRRLQENTHLIELLAREMDG
jgi:hypothetical protein